MKIFFITSLITVWMSFWGFAATASPASTPPILLPRIHLCFRDVEGIIVFPDSTVKTTFRVPVRLFGKALIYTSIQDGFRYRNPSGKLRFLNPKRVKKASFTYRGRDVDLVSRKIPGQGYLFVTQVLSGRVNCYTPSGPIVPKLTPLPFHPTGAVWLLGAPTVQFGCTSSMRRKTANRF